MHPRQDGQNPRRTLRFAKVHLADPRRFPLSAMDLVLDGVHVKQRLTGGETVFSVLAHAASSGGALSK
jgi:hypothetical protein